jgi:hypothetical protein
MPGFAGRNEPDWKCKLASGSFVVRLQEARETSLDRRMAIAAATKQSS